MFDLTSPRHANMRMGHTIVKFRGIAVWIPRVDAMPENGETTWYWTDEDGTSHRFIPEDITYDTITSTMFLSPKGKLMWAHLRPNRQTKVGLCGSNAVTYIINPDSKKFTIASQGPDPLRKSICAAFNNPYRKSSDSKCLGPYFGIQGTDIYFGRVRIGEVGDNFTITLKEKYRYMQEMFDEEWRKFREHNQ